VVLGLAHPRRLRPGRRRGKHQAREDHSDDDELLHDLLLSALPCAPHAHWTRPRLQGGSNGAAARQCPDRPRPPPTPPMTTTAAARTTRNAVDQPPLGNTPIGQYAL